MKRSRFFAFVAVPALLLSVPCFAAAMREKTNLIILVAEDLGYGDVGCFGQKLFETPRLDAMAAAGLRFTQFYAGSAADTPSRCVLLTGRHSGRAVLRGHPEDPSGLQKGQSTIASLLKGAGYTTGYIGAWTVGAPNDLANPNDLGFDYFFGWINSAHAQNAYPEFLVRNGARVKLNNTVGEKWKRMQDESQPKAGMGVAAERKEYAPDLLAADALKFLRDNKDKPFLLLWTLNQPRANPEAGDGGIEVPDTSAFAAKDWPATEKTFASAVRHVDRQVGQVMDALDELGLSKITLVVFTSSNGPHIGAGHDPEFFDSNGKYREAKGDIREGGIRVPAIAWWPGTVAAGSTNDHQWYAGDLLATAAELSGQPRPKDIDSDSLVPTLKGTPPKGQWDRKSPLYWEVYEKPTAQAVRFGKWKAIRSPAFTGAVELFDLSNDFTEKRDYSQRRADLLKHATNLLNKYHQPNAQWKTPTPSSAARSSQP